MAGVLRVICTPIGNLQDISPRALDALKTAKVIFAEDTRHSKKLFDAFAIDLSDKKLLSCHQQIEPARIEVAISKLAEGYDIALVTDAGAPGISDPGGRLVDAVAKAEYPIEVIPGPSAIIAALMGAGLVANRFAFLGFLPRKGGLRERLVKNAMACNLALVIFESPARITKTLEQLAVWCGAKRVVVARELTKKFETFHRGKLGGEMSPALIEKGEMVVVVEAASNRESRDVNPSLEEINDRVKQLIAKELPTKEASKLLAGEFGISKKEAYDLLLQELQDH